MYIDDNIKNIGEDILGKIVANIHISAKCIASLSSSNKMCAAETFLRTRNSYSMQAQKDWISYIKRQKMSLLKKEIGWNNTDLILEILQQVTLTPDNISSLIAYTHSVTYLLDNEEMDIICKLFEDFQEKKCSLTPKESYNTSEKIAYLIRKTPKSASGLKKTHLLECAVLFGNVTVLKEVWDKYAPFEYIGRALMLCVHLGDIEKLNVIKQGSSLLDISKDCSPLPVKYGNWDNSAIFSVLIDETISSSPPSFFCSFCDRINKTFSNLDGIEFSYSELPNSTNINRNNMIASIAEWKGPFWTSKLILYASLHGNIPMAKFLLEWGYEISWYDVSFLWDSSESKARKEFLFTLVDTAPEGRIFVLLQLQKVADREEKQIVFYPIILDFPELYHDPVFFQNLCAFSDCSKLKKSDLLRSLIDHNQAENLSYVLECPKFQFSKKLLKSMSEYASKQNNTVCANILRKKL